MGKFDGVLLATDFDDTFYSANQTVHPHNLERVEYFKSNGGIFTVATGRAQRTFSPYLDIARVNAPVVLSNGAQLYDFAADRMVLETCLPDTVTENLELLTGLIPELGLEAYHGEEVYIWNPNPWTWFHLNRARTGAEEREIAAIPQPWGKAILHQEHSILLRAQAAILDRWGDRYEAIFSNPNMLELTAKGSTKGSMVLELARRLGITRNNIYCIGDNQNDIPMLEVSAIPFAPANCADSVKASEPYLLPDCEDGAVGALIDVLDRRY